MVPPLPLQGTGLGVRGFQQYAGLDLPAIRESCLPSSLVRPVRIERHGAGASGVGVGGTRRHVRDTRERHRASASGVGRGRTLVLFWIYTSATAPVHRAWGWGVLLVLSWICT